MNPKKNKVMPGMGDNAFRGSSLSIGPEMVVRLGVHCKGGLL